MAKNGRARAVYSVPPSALTVITRAALTGALEHARPGLQLQRYQQLAAISVAACRTAGQPVPDGVYASSSWNQRPLMIWRPGCYSDFSQSTRSRLTSSARSCWTQ